MLHRNNDDSIVPIVIRNQLFVLEYRLNGIGTSTDTIQAHVAILFSLKPFLIKKFNSCSGRARKSWPSNQVQAMASICSLERVSRSLLFNRPETKHHSSGDVRVWISRSGG